MPDMEFRSATVCCNGSVRDALAVASMVEALGLPASFRHVPNLSRFYVKLIHVDCSVIKSISRMIAYSAFRYRHTDYIDDPISCHDAEMARKIVLPITFRFASGHNFKIVLNDRDGQHSLISGDDRQKVRRYRFDGKYPNDLKVSANATVLGAEFEAAIYTDCLSTATLHQLNGAIVVHAEEVERRFKSVIEMV